MYSLTLRHENILWAYTFLSVSVVWVDIFTRCIVFLHITSSRGHLFSQTAILYCCFVPVLLLGLRSQDIQFHSRNKAAAGPSLPGRVYRSGADPGHDADPHAALGALLWPQTSGSYTAWNSYTYTLPNWRVPKTWTRVSTDIWHLG